MAFNAGAIKSHLELDRSPFTQGLTEARRQGRRFAKHRWTATVDVDTSRARNSIRTLRSEMRNLNALSRHIQVSADTAGASAQLRALQKQAAGLGGSRSSAQASVDTARAQAEVSALRAQLAALDRTTATAQVGVRGAGAATAQVSVLRIALIGLAPAAVPVLAVIGAQAMALAGALAAAGAGAGVFGLAVVGQIKPLTDYVAELEAVETALAAAEPGTEQYNQLLAQQQQLLNSITPAQKAVIAEAGNLKSAFMAFGDPAQNQILTTFVNVLIGARTALETMRPAVVPLANAFLLLSERFREFSGGPEMQHFAAWVATRGPTAVLWFAQTLVNLGAVVANLVGAFSPLTNQLVSAEGSFARLREWTAGLSVNPRFQEFLAYVQANGPLVWSTLGSLANALIQVAWALAPIAPPILIVVGALADMVAQVAVAHPWVIQLAWGALLLSKVWGPMATGIGLVTTALKSQAAAWLLAQVRMVAYRAVMLAIRTATLVWTAAQWLLNIALSANPIGLIVIAIVAAVALIVGAVLYAWNNFDWFREGVIAVWTAIQQGAMWLWTNGIEPVVKWIVNAFQTYLLPAIQFVAGLYVQYITTMWTVVQTLWAFIWPIVQFIVYTAFALIITYVGIMWGVWKTAFNAIAAIVMWLWTNVVSPVTSFIVNAFLTYVVPMLVWVQGRWNAVMNFLGAVLRWLWTNVVSPVLGWIVNRFMWLYNRYNYYKNLLSAVFRAIGNYAHTLKDRIWAAFDKAKEYGSNLLSAFRGVRDSAKEIFRALANHARKPINFVINTVYNDGLRKVARSTLNAVGMSKMADKLPHADTIPAFAGGGSPQDPSGFVRGRGSGRSDSILARVANREFVVNARSTARFRPLLDWINNAGRRVGGSPGALAAGEVPGFKEGGFLSNALGFARDAVLGASKDALKDALDALGWSGWVSDLKSGPPIWEGAAGGALSMMSKGLLDFLGKEDAKGGGAMGVVKHARKAKMGGTDADNQYTRAFGMPGLPWCAMFVSEMIRRAKASKLYKNTRSAAVATFANSSMKSVGTGSGKPGDLAVYRGGGGPGGWSHINIVTNPKTRESIGGNEGNRIRKSYGYYSSAVKLMRPGLAQGGIPDEAMRNILGQDYDTNSRTTTPLDTQFMRVLAGLPAYAGGGTTGTGPALLGEQGPEMVEFGGRARVRTAAETADVLAEAIIRAMERMGHDSSGPATQAATQVVVNGLATEEVVEEIVRRLRAEAEMDRATTAAGMAPKPRG